MPSLLLHGAILLTVDPDDRISGDGRLSSEDGRIAELGSALPDPTPASTTKGWTSPGPW